MERPLKDHIALLEQKIENLKARQADFNVTAADRYQAVIDLERAERALAHYREAYELEKAVEKIAD